MSDVLQTDVPEMYFLSRRRVEGILRAGDVYKRQCYLYLTKTTKERMRMQSNFSSLCRGFIIPKEVEDVYKRQPTASSPMRYTRPVR